MKKVSGLMLSVVVASLLSGGWLYADGKATNEAKCKSCHGADGKGNAAMATGLKVDASLLDLTKATTKAKPDADLIKVVTDGKAGTAMAGFGKKLSAAEIQEVVTFLKGL